MVNEINAECFSLETSKPDRRSLNEQNESYEISRPFLIMPLNRAFALNVLAQESRNNLFTIPSGYGHAKNC